MYTHTHTHRETLVSMSPSSVRQKEMYDPDFLGERSFRGKVSVICKINELRQTAMQWEFCFHAVNSFCQNNRCYVYMDDLYGFSLTWFD